MKDVDDARWRDAAVTLGLDLVDADGRVVPPADGARHHRMRGRVDDRRVRVRHGDRDGITTIDLTLRRPLLLGLAAQWYRNPRPASNRFGVVRRRVFSSLRSIDPARGQALLEAASAGVRLDQRLTALGSQGWVELTDERLRVQAEVFVDSSGGWAGLVRLVSETAQLAEAARAALPVLRWEDALVAHLEAHARPLGLALDRAAFQLSGTLHGMRVSVRLEAAERYALLYRVSLPARLPEGSTLTLRDDAPSLLERLLRVGRGAATPAWDSRFEVSRPLRPHLTAGQRDALSALANRGDPCIEEDRLTFRTADLADAAAPTLDALVAIADEWLRGPRGSGPYR